MAAAAKVADPVRSFGPMSVMESVWPNRFESLYAVVRARMPLPMITNFIGQATSKTLVFQLLCHPDIWKMQGYLASRLSKTGLL